MNCSVEELVHRPDRHHTYIVQFGLGGTKGCQALDNYLRNLDPLVSFQFELKKTIPVWAYEDLFCVSKRSKPAVAGAQKS